MTTRDGISAIRIFGSAARGDADDLSDTDVIVVQGKRTSEPLRKKIEFELSSMGPNVSICWYSERTLTAMFRKGHLFAWHLFKESFNPFEARDFIDDLKTPHRYTTAGADIRGFQEIIAGIPSSIHTSAGNACYEAGLMFVCCRNVAMIASSYIAGGPYFGRNSPFDLCKVTGIEFPLTIEEHTSNMRARTFGHYGKYLECSAVDILRMTPKIDGWARNVLNLVEIREQRRERQKYEIH